MTKHQTHRAYHLWTKDELKQFVKLWESSTVEEMAETFDVSRATIYSISKKFRDEGLEITRKRRNGNMNTLIRETIAELSGKKR